MSAVRAQNRPITMVREEYHFWCCTTAATKIAAAWKHMVHHASCRLEVYLEPSSTA